MTALRPFFVILFCAIVLLFVGLGKTSMFQSTEALHSQVPVEMLNNHDYVVPHLNGAARPGEPPLPYFAMLLAYCVAGVSEGAARFFSACCGLLVIIATWMFARKFAGRAVAAWSCIVLLASFFALFQFRFATPAPYFICCYVLSLFCFWTAYKENKKAYLWTMYVLWGLGLLSKGPTGLLLPAITISIFLLSVNKFRWTVITSLQPLTGFLLVCLIGLPWYYLIGLKTSGPVMPAVLTNGADDNSHTYLFLLSSLLVLVGLFPFSVFIIRPVVQAWKQRNNNQWLYFNLVAATVIIVANSFQSPNLISYAAASYPFLAMLLGAWIENTYKRHSPVSKGSAEWLVLLLLSILLPACIYLWMIGETAMRPIAFLVGWLLVLPAAIAAGFYCYKRAAFKAAFFVAAGGAIVMNGLFFLKLLPAIDREGSITWMKIFVQNERPVIALNKFNESFLFYHRKPIKVMSAANMPAYIKIHPNVLILEQANYSRLRDSLPGLSLKAKAKDLFSRQYSFLYELDKP